MMMQASTQTFSSLSPFMCLVKPRLVGLVVGFVVCLSQAQSPDSSLSFFITGTSLGKGGNLGGLAGADNHCQSLAQAVGAGTRTWRAYLSTQALGAALAVNAKDRIGSGPWFNAKRVKVAENIADLHSDQNKLSKENSLTEKGDIVKGRGDNPNQHDILTGSHADGTAYDPSTDMTCSNWTSETTGKAMLGHHDRHGVASNIDSTSWNESHASNGCTQANLVSTGGNGYFYCFALEPASTDLKTGRIPIHSVGKTRTVSQSFRNSATRNGVTPTGHLLSGQLRNE